MTGIKVVKNANKYTIQYARELDVKNAQMYDENYAYYDKGFLVNNVPIPIEGLGLVQNPGGSVKPVATSVEIGHTSQGLGRYFSALKTAGLLPLTQINPTYKTNVVANDGENVNTSSFMGFIRHYTNNGQNTGIVTSVAAGTVTVADDRIKDMTINLLSTSLGAIADSGTRRDGDGKAIDTYRGKLSVPEVNYLKSLNRDMEFKNANIYRNGADFIRDNLTTKANGVTLNLTNSMLKGDMYNHKGITYGGDAGLVICGDYKGKVW
ncbi:MAG: hypothetical protein LBB48_04855 [Treponema sp.]|jgi:hypothetical protein|nr:hypothetical protein [Treponema sp.]